MFAFHPLALLPLTTVTVGTLLVAYTLRRMYATGFDRLLTTFVALASLVTLWATVQFLWLILTDVGVMKRLHMPLALLTWLSACSTLPFALEYTDNSQWRSYTRQYLVGISLLAGIYAIVLWYQPAVVATGTDTIGSMRYLQLEQTFHPLSHSLVLVSYGHLAVALYLFARMMFNNQRLYRIQGALLVFAVLLPAIGSSLFWLAGAVPIDPTPSTQSLTSVLIAFSIFRLKILDVSPVARNNVIEEMNEGYLVVDEDGTILDHNPAAAHMFDAREDLVGTPIESIIQDSDRLLGDSELDSLTVRSGSTDQYLSVAASEMEYGGRTGHLLIVTDITAIVEREQELELLNRVVRHDIQNDMTVVNGYARTAKNRLDDGEFIDPIIDGSEHAIDLCDTVKDLLETITEDEELELESVNVRDALEAELEKARAAHDEATFEIADEIDSEIHVAANQMISSVFTNLFNNAVRHNDRETPEITVSVDAAGDTVRVTVTDNGPGVPEDQKDEIFGRGEKGLESPGTGVGLYLVDTLVDQYGGDVWVENADPRGAAFVVELQRSAPDSVAGQQPETPA